MTGRTYIMHNTTGIFWDRPENIPADQARGDYSVDGQVQTSVDFATTITIPDGMWVLESGGFGDDTLSRREEPRNWVGRQRPRCINLGQKGSGLYLNHLMLSPEPFAIILGVPRGERRSGRAFTLLDIHDQPFCVRVKPARQIHKGELGRRIEVRGLPTAAVERRPFGRTFSWVSVDQAMEATEQSASRLLLDWWPLVRYEGNLRSDATIDVVNADRRELIHRCAVDETMRQAVTFEEMERMVADEATVWSHVWIPRGFVRDIMLLMQFGWYMPTRRNPVKS